MIGTDMKRKQYAMPKLEVLTMCKMTLLATSKPHWNDVGNFGFGDNEDDDREGDDNWDKDWNW